MIATEKSKTTNEELVARFQAGDEYALVNLLKQNAGLIGQMVRRYFPGQFIDEDHDGYQAGKIAIWLAATKFDPTRDRKFTTYLHRVLLTHVSAEWYLSKLLYVPRGTAQGEAGATRDRARKFLGRADPIALTRKLIGALPLYCTVDDDQYSYEEERAKVRSIVAGLSPRQRIVYESLIVEGQTLVVAGKKLGLSRERVRQIKVTVINRIVESVKADA